MSGQTKPQELPNGTEIMGDTKAKKTWKGKIVGWSKQGTRWKYEVECNHKSAHTYEIASSIKKLPALNNPSDGSPQSVRDTSSPGNLYGQFFSTGSVSP
jgi:hypothetical protein